MNKQENRAIIEAEKQIEEWWRKVSSTKKLEEAMQTAILDMATDETETTNVCLAKKTKEDLQN